MSTATNPDFGYNPNSYQIPIKERKRYQGYKVFVLKGNNKHPLVYGEISWRDNIETLGMEVNFDIPRNFDDKHMKRYDIVDVGDGILFTNMNNEIFRGIVTTIDFSRYSKKITAHDYAYYFNKSKTIIQFNKMSGSSAIKKLCKENNVPIGSIENMNVKITEIYNNQSISDIIKDIINKQKDHNGGEYRMEMRKGKLYVFKANNKKIKPTFKPARNIGSFDPTKAPSEISRTDTMDGMLTKVKVVLEEDKKYKVLATEVDTKNLKKYGLFQEVISINKDESKNAKKIAKQKLKDHKGIQQTISISMLGDDKVRSGRVLALNNEIFGLKGDYLITDCQHSYVNGHRRMQLEVKRV